MLERRTARAAARRRLELARRRCWARVRRVAYLRLAGILAVAMLGAWLGLLVGARVSGPVGPVDTTMHAHLSWGGDTLVKVGPLGSLQMDTHDGPIRVTVEVDGLNIADAQRLVDDPAAFEGLQQWISSDVKAAIRALVIRSALCALAGAILLCLLVYRRRIRRLLAVALTATALIGASAGTAAATWSPQAVAEPTYTGLLGNAPSVVGNARDIVAGFSDYGQSLAKLVGNVGRLYDVTSTLPAYEPDLSTIRVLHVADVHLNPAAWEVISSITRQFEVRLIIDAGDISDHGSAAENRFVNSIADLGVPYVFVRGNHDSAGTEAAVRRQPNAVVLDGGDTREVAGLRISGAGDPRFTPDKSGPQWSNAQLEALGESLARKLELAPHPPDIFVTHDPAMARPLDGEVPLILAGHTHKRSTELLAEGTRIFTQGSTGGAGLRALEGEAPTPIEATVFYFDAQTKRLQAWDDLTIGGLGLSSVAVSRTLAPEELARVKADNPSAATALPLREDLS
ncbi:MAG: metallophosphoesterase family protein [Sporichthyaceae bacterium]